MKKTFVSLIVLIAGMLQVFAQAEKPEVMAEKDGVVISSQWKLLKNAEKKKENALCLTVQNTSKSYLSCRFVVSFYNSGSMEEQSAPIDLCIKPGKKRKGKKYGLCLVGAEEEYDPDNEAYAWEIEELEVKEVESCKTKK